MTNILAIATLITATSTSEIKTNVTTTPFEPSDNSRWLVVRETRNEKWEKTVIEKVDTLSFEWNGNPFTVKNATPISTNIVHLKIKEEWEVVKDK